MRMRLEGEDDDGRDGCRGKAVVRREIITAIDIVARPECVWAVLLDFPAYGEWNPFIRRIEGVARMGEVLRVSMQIAKGRPMTFRPRVQAAKSPRKLCWLGHLGLPGLFDGEHYFQLTALPSGLTRFTHGERFSGLLAGLFAARMMGPTEAAFVAMNEALRQRAEAQDAARGAHDP